MNIRCEGCDATPTTLEQKLCRFCGFEFNYSKLEIAEENVIEVDEFEDPATPVENVNEPKEEKSGDSKTEIETEQKVDSAKENAETDAQKPKKGAFKKLFGKK